MNFLHSNPKYIIHKFLGIFKVNNSQSYFQKLSKIRKPLFVGASFMPKISLGVFHGTELYNRNTLRIDIKKILKNSCFFLAANKIVH